MARSAKTATLLMPMNQLAVSTVIVPHSSMKERQGAETDRQVISFIADRQMMKRCRQNEDDEAGYGKDPNKHRLLS